MKFLEFKLSVDFKINIFPARSSGHHQSENSTRNSCLVRAHHHKVREIADVRKFTAGTFQNNLPNIYRDQTI